MSYMLQIDAVSPTGDVNQVIPETRVPIDRCQCPDVECVATTAGTVIIIINALSLACHKFLESIVERSLRRCFICVGVGPQDTTTTGTTTGTTTTGRLSTGTSGMCVGT